MMGENMENIKDMKEAFRSIIEDNFEDLKAIIIEKKVDANVIDDDGMTLLVQAAYKGNDEMCRLLLNHGADVNMKSRNNDYTALMMAALAAKPSTVELLLANGAKTDLKNSIGKTASELSAFVGQQECSDIIRNFLSMDLLSQYFTPQGSNEARISQSVACQLQSIAMATNYTPVKMVQMIAECEELCNVETLKKACGVMDDLCNKCVRAHGDFEEVLALKCHYISYVMEQCSKHMKNNQQTADVSKYLKRLVKEDDGGVKIYSEDVIRKAVSTFPYTTLPVIEEFVKTIYPLKIGQRPTANYCLHTIFNGLRSSNEHGPKCMTCGQKNAQAKCSACKKVQYCSATCQKLHWSVHKTKCKK